MTYRIAQNQPLDLYFVLDFSTTMKTRLDSLADLTQNLSMHDRTDRDEVKIFFFEQWRTKTLTEL